MRTVPATSISVMIVDASSGADVVRTLHFDFGELQPLADFQARDAGDEAQANVRRLCPIQLDGAGKRGGCGEFERGRQIFERRIVGQIAGKVETRSQLALGGAPHR